jgi:valyl-tRNA synthetase
MTMEKTFDAATAEARIAQEWDARNCFAAGANASRDETFCIMIPPPNVTGSLHMGHAFNNTLQDILVRWHRMRGFDTLWQPGQDHAGIATQMVVERELAKTQQPSRREMGREAFLAKVWEWKEQSGDTIINQLKRLGASCDWSRNAFTMDETFQKAVIKVFVEMYNKGLIYRGKRLVNWDPHFETAISDLEVENEERPGHMWHFKYILAGGETYEYIEKDADGNVTLRETRNYISIATTRPETMLGDGAVAVNPSDERYAPIVGKMVHLPLCDRLIPIVADEYPDPTFGSGAVKITGAHDFNDYQVAKRCGLPLYRLMDTRANMRADGASYADAVARAREIAAGAEASEAEIDTLNLVPEKYRGMARDDARKAVIEDINALGLAVMVEETYKDEDGEDATRLVPYVESKPIMQPFGDRSKVIIEPMLTDQWFVETSKIVEPALDAVRSGKVKIMPESGEKVYYHWLENIEPWCISRQLWWGHQVPVWYDDEGNHYCAASEEEATALAGGKSLTRDPDVLDTWFSSGLWPIGTLGWPEQTPELAKYFPTNVLVTGQDILFFWVARMMMMQLAVVDDIPFDTVYLHGLVRDAKGKKMSKSLGNVVDPLEIIDEYGADALRFTNAAMASLGGVLKLDMQRIAGYRNFGTKIWNATRFAEMNGVFEGTPAQGIPTPSHTVNRWIIGETAKVREAVDDALANYRFNDAAQSLYAFVWGKVCDWYVEFAKPLFDGEHADETRATMRWVLDQCFIMTHPIMPFITEELWSLTGTRSKMLVHGDWPIYTSGDLVDAEADREMNWVIGLIEEIRSSRTQMGVPVGLKLPLVLAEADEAAKAAITRNEALIFRLARVDSITETAIPKGSISIAAPGAVFGLPLEGVIDVQTEKARLEKALAKIEKEAAGLRNRLGNPKFVENATQEVIDESRANLNAREEEVAQIAAAVKRLADL